MGYSHGGSHALACAALLPERVLSVVSVAGLAPFGAEGLDWFGGFGLGGAAELRAAAAGRAALEKHLAESDEEPDFTPEDEAALAGEWSWFMEVVDAPALAGGTGGFVDDDLAGVGAWGFDPPPSSLRPSSCTAAGTGSCPPRTASGSRTGSPRPNCGCTRTTDTSRSSTTARRPWSGCGSKPKGAEPASGTPPAPSRTPRSS